MVHRAATKRRLADCHAALRVAAAYNGEGAGPPPFAAELPKSFIRKHQGMIVENHLDIRALGQDPGVSAAVIAALLGSAAVDAAFRCLNGSVAVSAFELEELPLPGPASMARLMRAVERGATPAEVEAIIAAAYGECDAAALLDVAEIHRRLLLIFPEGTPQRNYCTLEMAARTVFVMLYIGAIEGTDVWMAPKQVYRMGAAQAPRIRTPTERRISRRSIAADRKRRRTAGSRTIPASLFGDETLRDGLVRTGAVVTRPGTRDDLLARPLCVAVGFRVAFRAHAVGRTARRGHCGLAGPASVRWSARPCSPAAALCGGGTGEGARYLGHRRRPRGAGQHHAGLSAAL
ncbi:MAG TPA: hypothetical protein VG651_20295 [Stellaceae bacterium]|nr:hypothetical protein [Stellaceae bacterium]